MSRPGVFLFRGHRDERGAFLILFAVMVVALLTMAAIVIDLSALRQDKRADSLAADLSATAGAFNLDAVFGGSASAACNDAWTYFLTNRPDASPVITPPNCGGAGSPFLTTCVPATSRLVTGRAGPYTFTITQPVTDAQLATEFARQGTNQAVEPTIDGDACRRFGVTIERDRDFVFANVVGQSRGSTTVHSVARTSEGRDGEPAALLVLDQAGCDALETSGKGSILVEDTVTLLGEEKPGIIAVDSDGRAAGNAIPGCSNANSYVIDANNNSLNFIRAEPTPSGLSGIIRSYAMGVGNAAKAYDPADPVSGSPPRLSPTPTAGSRRITRAPIDHRYNCKVANGCGDTPNPYIDQLVASLGGSGATPPAGYRIYPDELVTPPPLSGEVAQPQAACSMASSAAAVVVPVGNWFVNCNGGLSVSNSVTFSGGNVVTRAGVNVGAAGSITFNAAGTTPGNNGVLFIRSGDLEKGGQASLILESVTVYHGAPGRINIGAGSTGTLRWIAPFTGNFEDLAYWSEVTTTNNATKQNLGGQAGLALEGVLFTPNAQFVFSGQPGVNQTNAQFIAHRLLASGQGELRMRPDPERVVLLPIRGVRLIR